MTADSLQPLPLMAFNIKLTHFQGCSGAGTRGNGVSTPFSRFALK